MIASKKYFIKELDLEWKKTLLSRRSNRRGPDCSMSDAEMMTIVILVHQSNYRTFKLFYQQYVPSLLSREFPKRVSYSRFVFLMKGLSVPLFVFFIITKRLLVESLTSIPQRYKFVIISGFSKQGF
jgi:hypothetical protein